MPITLQLPTPQFAVWAREHGVRLPYPLDISGVPGAGQQQPDAAAPQLAQLAEIASAPRLAAFRQRLDPTTGTSECAVAVSDDESGVLVSMSAGLVEIRAVPATELVIGLGATMPALPALPIETTSVSEQRWNEALRALTRPDAAAALEPMELPVGLARAMLTTPRSIGTLGAVTWADGASTLGPLLASWFEYRGGTLLARLEAARGPGGDRSVVLAPYSPAAAVSALGLVVTDALRTARR